MSRSFSVSVVAASLLARVRVMRYGGLCVWVFVVSFFIEFIFFEFLNRVSNFEEISSVRSL